MSVKTKLRPLTLEEYLEGEQHSEIRHELVGGQPCAMVGASKRHNLVAGRLYAILLACLRKPCQVYISDVKVRVDNDFYYPDIVVSCVKQDYHPYYESNPTLIIEVLSDSTERIDRQEKRLAYQRLTSLREYVLLAQDKLVAEVYRRVADGWELERFEGQEALRLEAVDLSVPLAEIYADVIGM